MPRFFILLLLALSALVSSCSCYTRQNGKSDQQEEITRLNSTIDCLQGKISELEEQNFNQESRIKDLEDDLESVITFLNNELDYLSQQTVVPFHQGNGTGGTFGTNPVNNFQG